MDAIFDVCWTMHVWTFLMRKLPMMKWVRSLKTHLKLILLKKLEKICFWKVQVLIKKQLRSSMFSPQEKSSVMKILLNLFRLSWKYFLAHTQAWRQIPKICHEKNIWSLCEIFITIMRIFLNIGGPTCDRKKVEERERKVLYVWKKIINFPL